MPRDRRPAAVLVVAILNMFFGGMNLLGMLCGVPLIIFIASIPMPGPVGNPYQHMYQYFNQRIPFIPIMIGGLLYAFLMTAALLVSGIGLWKMRRWAHRLAIGYAIVQLVYIPVSIVVGIIWFNPLISGWLDEFTKQSSRPGSPPPPAIFGEGFYAVASAFGGILGAVYPITILILLLLPHVRAAFASAGPPTIAPEEQIPDALDASTQIAEKRE